MTEEENLKFCDESHKKGGLYRLSKKYIFGKTTEGGQSN